MYFGAETGAGLELRRKPDGSVNVGGKFPYNVSAVLSDGGRRGRPKKERIASHAFKYRIETPSQHDGKAKEIHLLAGHDFNRPLASVRSGTLKLVDTAAALLFQAVITRQVADTQHGSDSINLMEAGLSVGVSPGFRLPPERAVAEAEKIEDEGSNPEEGEHNAIIRTVIEALLYELSIVTRPAYPETQVELRSWSVSTDTGLVKPIRRWRA